MKFKIMVTTQKKLSEKQRKFLLVLPVLVLPFLTIFLWILGVVGGNEVKASVTTGGLNMSLPNARSDDNKGWNKLSFYEQADKDSAKYKEAIKNDPFYQKVRDSSIGSGGANVSSIYNPLPPQYSDSSEYRVTQKLAQLNYALNSRAKDQNESNRNAIPQQQTIQSHDVNRLEQMLQNMNQTDSDADPETQQLNTMMDKILDIQHPERVSERIQQQSEKNKKEAFPVTLRSKEIFPSLLQSGTSNKTKNRFNTSAERNTFYSLTEDSLREQIGNSVEAEVQETQIVVSGSVLKLCLSTDIYVNGVLIPKGTFVFGTASQSGERLDIAIIAIRYQNSLLPVFLSVYDLDGLPGIHIPGSINRDVAKQAGSEAMSNVGLSSLDPSLGAQAADAGIAAAKHLINKKVKLIKCIIKAGYQVLLRNDNQQ